MPSKTITGEHPETALLRGRRLLFGGEVPDLRGQGAWSWRGTRPVNAPRVGGACPPVLRPSPTSRARTRRRSGGITAAHPEARLHTRKLTVPRPSPTPQLHTRRQPLHTREQRLPTRKLADSGRPTSPLPTRRLTKSNEPENSPGRGDDPPKTGEERGKEGRREGKGERRKERGRKGFKSEKKPARNHACPPGARSTGPPT